MENRVKLNDLRGCFEAAKAAKANYIAVAIETRGSDELETIINPRANFEGKQAYYEKAYNDDLVLKTFDGIRITRFCHGNTFAELEALLNYEEERDYE